MSAPLLEVLESRLENLPLIKVNGRIVQVVGLVAESQGPDAKVGDFCKIRFRDENLQGLDAEVVGFKDNRVLLMPLGNLREVGPGCEVISSDRPMGIGVGQSLLGRVLDGMGEPLDGRGPIVSTDFYPLHATPPHPLKRQMVESPLSVGVRVMDGLLTLGTGQRIGIFSGSGVGKSTLLGMIARYAVADINVIVLVGERGREVKDFVERDLGEEGLKKSVLVIATSDQPALLRLKCAMTGTAIAEYFRDCGYKVLLLMDSLTRFAMAQREIGMAAGEPPVSRGFPPSVYSLLPKLLERSGTSDKGSITGLYTVLVEGDDLNEPISDTVRGILDGHIVLSRAIANSNHYPPIDILGSVSRVMPDIVTEGHMKAFGSVKNMIAVYREAEDLINIGAYKQGANPEIDRAVALHPAIQGFLRQGVSESYKFDEINDMLMRIAES